MKRMIGLLLAVSLCVALILPASAATSNTQGFDDYGGYTDTKIEYSFLIDKSALVYGGDVDLGFDYEDDFFAGSAVYIPLGAYDTEATGDSGETIATDKQIKNDKVTLSYKLLRGEQYVESVTLVSAKKEKLKDLPAGMYAKIQYSGDYISFTSTNIAVRLVLSVAGVSYPDTTVTFRCNLINRAESITENTVHGALTPVQFKVGRSFNGTPTFDFGEGVRYTVKVKANDRYYLNLDRSENAALKKMYPDSYLEFYSFKGAYDTFPQIGTLEIPINESKFKEKKTGAQLYVYELNGNTLKALKNTVSYNPKTKKLTIRTKSLNSYVLSSRALMKNVDKNADEDILRSGYASEEEPSTSVASK